MITALTNALKKQPDFAINALAQTLGAHNSPTGHADLTPGAVIALAAPKGEQNLETQARNLVGQTFFGTLLKQMRDSPFKSELFSGGKGGEAFGQMYDSTLAQRMARRSGGKLTRPIIKKFGAAAKAAYEKQHNGSKQFTEENRYVAADHRA